MPIQFEASPAPSVNEEFERIFREHHQLVYRTAYRVIGNAEDAEDVLQTVFLKFLRREFQMPLEDVKRYLYRAAVNVSLDVVRSRRRRRFVSGVELLEAGATPIDAEEEMRNRLCEALTELHPRSAEILILRYTHGYSDSEIAKLLGTSRGTIAVSLFRSRARLKKLVKAVGEKR